MLQPVITCKKSFILVQDLQLLQDICKILPTYIWASNLQVLQKMYKILKILTRKASF